MSNENEEMSPPLKMPKLAYYPGPVPCRPKVEDNFPPPEISMPKLAYYPNPNYNPMLLPQELQDQLKQKGYTEYNIWNENLTKEVAEHLINERPCQAPKFQSDREALIDTVSKHLEEPLEPQEYAFEWETLVFFLKEQECSACKQTMDGFCFRLRDLRTSLGRKCRVCSQAANKFDPFNTEIGKAIDRLLDLQHYKCMICTDLFAERFKIDTCHRNKCQVGCRPRWMSKKFNTPRSLRGLLCNLCNTGGGHTDTDYEMTFRLAAYKTLNLRLHDGPNPTPLMDILLHDNYQQRYQQEYLDVFNKLVVGFDASEKETIRASSVTTATT